MEMVKKVLLGLIIFSLAFFVGAFYRATWFFTFQKGQFERRYLYRDLAESKLGGQTPQETWNLYLDALAKGDIDVAVQYWVPEKRQGISSHFSELKQAGVLARFTNNHEKDLKPSKKNTPLDKDEKAFSYSYLSERSIDFVGAKGEVLDFLEDYWSEKKENEIKTEEELVFVQNKFSKLWLIKE